MGWEGDWVDENPNIPCRKCGVKGFIESREWESDDGGHTDYKFRCAACGGDWWAEGPDA